MKTVLFIRHGLTAGNREKRYIGRTDEPLCGEGLAQVRAMGPPRCDTVFVSPMARCRQTADILFPNTPHRVIQDLKECDFGIFEGKTAAELANCPAYRAWVDSRCLSPIPGGEDIAAFRARCCEAFLRAVSINRGTPAFVTHGGCIMAVLERFARPKRGFFDYHIGNARCVHCAFDGGTLTVTGGLSC